MTTCDATAQLPVHHCEVVHFGGTMRDTVKTKKAEVHFCVCLGNFCFWKFFIFLHYQYLKCQIIVILTFSAQEQQFIIKTLPCCTLSVDKRDTEHLIYTSVVWR